MRKSTCLLLLFCLPLLGSLLTACQPRAGQVVSAGKAAPRPSPNMVLDSCIILDGMVRAECGVLRVAEDRANPARRSLDLKIIVVRARDASHAPDPLYYLTGGPGLPATYDMNVSKIRTALWDINARHDIVFLDQRGTNDKHRLICPPFPTAITADTPQQQVDDWMQSCLSGLDGDPRFYTSAAFVRDLDDARTALGYDKINLYGISYGVAAAQVYMRMFPEHVRAAVLDHGTALDVPFRYVLPNASQSALDQVFAACEQDVKCHAAYPDIRGDWQKVMDRLAKGPVMTHYTPPGWDKPASVSMELFVEGINETMAGTQGYARVPLLIHTFASSADWTAIVQRLNEQNASVVADNRKPLMFYSILCYEPAWGALPDQVARYSPDSYYLVQEVAILQEQHKICASLPPADPAQVYGPGKPVPLSALMLNSILDPQNPPANMTPALKEFTHSRVVVESSEGHEPSDSACRWGIITQYIQQGSVDGLDISCLQDQKPSFVID